MKYVNRPHFSLPFFPSLNRIKVFKDLDGQSYTKKKWENLRKRITRFTVDSSQFLGLNGDPISHMRQCNATGIPHYVLVVNDC